MLIVFWYTKSEREPKVDQPSAMLYLFFFILKSEFFNFWSKFYSARLVKTKRSDIFQKFSHKCFNFCIYVFEVM